MEKGTDTSMRGVWTALITPFNEKNEIDFPAFGRIIQNQVSAGITGVIPCGTTGESPTLSTGEKKRLIQFTLDELKGTGVKVVAGTGTNDTEKTIEFSTWAAQQGVDGLLIVAPYYNKPSQKGLELHFQMIADAIPCEIILYNVPGRTGVCLSAETVAHLAGHPKIRTLKEASGQVFFTSEILETVSRKGRSIDILSGDDATYFPLLCVGAVGVISVASNLCPRAMVSIQRSIEQGQLETAKKIHQLYYPLFRDLFVESNPVPIKFALSTMGWCTPSVRLPLTPLSNENALKLKATLHQCGINPGKPNQDLTLDELSN